jgi:hypothetical protein
VGAVEKKSQLAYLVRIGQLLQVFHLCARNVKKITKRVALIGRENGLVTSNSWEKIEKELSKCVLLCANCHRIIHYELNSEKD